MSQVLTAAILYISREQADRRRVLRHVPRLRRGELLGVPIVVYYLVAHRAVVLWYVLEWTPLGRNLFATGANQEAARLAGVRTDRLVSGSLVASAVVAGLAGVVYGAKVGSLLETASGRRCCSPRSPRCSSDRHSSRTDPTSGEPSSPSTSSPSASRGCNWASQGSTYWITPFFNGVALLIAVAFAARSDAIPMRKRSARLAAVAAPELTVPAAEAVGTEHDAAVPADKDTLRGRQ